MGTWTSQKGFPVLTSSNGEISVNKNNWIVPVFLAASDGFKVILSRYGESVSNPEFAMVNPGRLGFYRVIGNSTEKISLMSACDRLTLLSDAFYGLESRDLNCSEPGQRNYEGYLAMVIRDYKKETAYTVLKELFVHIDKLTTIFETDFRVD